jgi:hypothetical protein
MPPIPDDPLRCDPPGTHLRALLPWDDGLGVVQVDPPSFRLKADIPIENPGHYRLCASGCHALVLDHDQHRLRVFALGPECQPTEIEVPALPEGRVFDVAMADGAFFAGGLLHDEPMAWSCSRIRGSVAGGGTLDLFGWSQLPMPELGGPRGKAVDLVFWRHGDLIAVDDLIYPRWNIVFDVRSPRFPEHRATVRLPDHTTYERVRLGALGDRYLALYSSGNNHGVSSSHLSILCADSLRECACYSAIRSDSSPPNWRLGDTEPDVKLEPSPLASIRRLAFAGDVLYALSSEDRVLCLDLRGPKLPIARSSQPRLPGSQAHPGPEPTELDLLAVRTVHDIATVGSESVAVAGLNEWGSETVEWVPVEQG